MEIPHPPKPGILDFPQPVSVQNLGAVGIHLRMLQRFEVRNIHRLAQLNRTRFGARLFLPAISGSL